MGGFRASSEGINVASYPTALAWYGATETQAMRKAGVIASSIQGRYYYDNNYVAIGPGATDLTLDLNELTINANQTGTLAIASITPDNALNQSFAWRSSNPAVATVTTGGTSATVTGKSAGTATITASTLEGTASAAAVVTVNAGPAPIPTPPKTGDDSPLWLWVTLAGISLLAIGTLYTLNQRAAAQKAAK